MGPQRKMDCSRKVLAMTMRPEQARQTRRNHFRFSENVVKPKISRSKIFLFTVQIQPSLPSRRQEGRIMIATIVGRSRGPGSADSGNLEAYGKDVWS